VIGLTGDAGWGLVITGLSEHRWDGVREVGAERDLVGRLEFSAELVELLADEAVGITAEQDRVLGLVGLDDLVDRGGGGSRVAGKQLWRPKRANDPTSIFGYMHTPGGGSCSILKPERSDGRARRGSRSDEQVSRSRWRD
jgi:hypothetical protein